MKTEQTLARCGVVWACFALVCLALGCSTSVQDRYPNDTGLPPTMIETNAAGVVSTNAIHFGGGK